MLKNHKEFDNVWDEWRDGTFEDVILAKAKKIKNAVKKADKLNAAEEIVNYAKRYMDRLITGK